MRGVALRETVGFLAGRAALAALRGLGRGGSTLPGLVGLRLAPQLLAELARTHRLGNVLVTGTNGKTTTARLLAGMAGLAGVTLAHNRAGANLPAGVATAFLAAVRLEPGPGTVTVAHPDLGLAEVDEAAFSAVAAAVRPRLVVVTNFFRDQLDRYGELARTVRLVGEGLDRLPGAVRVLNADDPQVAWLGRGAGSVLYYGLALPAGAGDAGGQAGAREPGDPAAGHDGGAASAELAEARRCRACGAELAYAARFYAHLGRYRCAGCGWERPEPEVAVTAARREEGGVQVEVRTPAGSLAARLPVAGTYNLYNAAAAVAAGYALGFPLAVLAQGLETYSPGFGRLERLSVEGREVVVGLVKNPVGFGQVLAALEEAEPGPLRLVIAINDLAADGRDVSWLWDADLERLAAGAARPADGEPPGGARETGAGDAAALFCVAAGLRAEEMALRLKYAGVPEGAVRLERDLERALRAGLEATPPGGRLWVLPTYTALLRLRTLLQRRGLAPRYWQV